jgi:hypothetical protein
MAMDAHSVNDELAAQLMMPPEFALVLNLW